MHRSVAVLVGAHLLAASVVVLALSQLGRVVAAVAATEVRVAVVLVGGLVAAAVDVRAIARGTPTWGLSRQTPKSLAHDPDRPWWVTPLIWGADTGMVWTTFRVSSASWLLLSSAALGLAPWWAGAVYGACFALPLGATILWGRGDAPVGQTRPRATGAVMRVVQAVGVVLLLVPLAAACTGGDEPAAACDDRVRPSAVPAATRARMAEHGITGAVGEGDVWFVTPVDGRWSSLLEGRRAKVALWVDTAGPVPAVAVRQVGGDGRGEASSSPTADGLPGPVPTTLTFPGDGCWRVEAGGARVTFEVG